MDEERFIIYGVLNWGLGHATRSVPVIKALINHGYTPVIASDGIALDYLRAEFPYLHFEEIPSYKITYGQKSFLGSMTKRLPGILKATMQEKRQLEKLLLKYDACGVISDNRLGFYTQKVPSVYITHQLKMILPRSLSWVNKIHHFYIQKYRECWIPDFPGGILGGKLSEVKGLKIKARYAGALSRFSKENNSVEKRYDMLIILSGPEPQRSILEKRIVEQLEEMKGRFMLIRGIEESMTGVCNFEIRGMVVGGELRKFIDSAKIVVSRSGYSSVMDYFALGNKALLIPTPGQPEQEYLAAYLKAENIFHSVSQNDFNLKEDLEEAMAFDGFSVRPHVSDDRYPDWKELLSLFESERKS